MATLATLESKLGHTAEGERHVARATEIEPHNPDVLYAAAVVHALGNRKDKAIEALQQAVDAGYSSVRAGQTPIWPVSRPIRAMRRPSRRGKREAAMRIRQIVGMRFVLVGVVLSAMVVPETAAAQAVTPVNVLIKNSCAHQVNPPTAKLHTSTKDLLRWRIQNDCGQAQPVLICVCSKATNLLKNPFKPCKPAPDVHDVGKTFVVASNDHATSIARPRTRSFGRVRKQVRVGTAEVPPPGCPGVFQRRTTKAVPGAKPVKILMHALDVDVVP